MSEDLAKKKQLALTQIRWQANVITVFFFLVLGFSAAHAGVFVSALLESPDGRWMTTLAATLVIWGRVALNGLARTCLLYTSVSNWRLSAYENQRIPRCCCCW